MNGGAVVVGIGIALVCGGIDRVIGGGVALVVGTGFSHLPFTRSRPEPHPHFPDLSRTSPGGQVTGGR